MTGTISLVNALLLACAPPPPVPGPTLQASDRGAWSASRYTTGLDEALQRWERADAPPRPPSLPSRMVPELLGAPSFSRATYSEEPGEALDQRMRDFTPSQIQNFSVTLLSADELFGTEDTPGLCESPIIEVTLDDGQEAGLSVYPYSAILNSPEPMWVTISGTCVDGVADTAGDVEAAIAAGTCAEDEAQTFFPPGSDCRACVEDSGDFAGCAEDCPSEAPLAVWMSDESGERYWYRAATATGWACAPGWLAPFYLLSTMDQDGALPQAFDHESWAFLCTPFWDEDAGEPRMGCQGSTEPVDRGALVEGLFGFAAWIHPPGEEIQSWRGRHYYVDSVRFTTGATLSWSWAYGTGLGLVSAPRVIEDTNGSGDVDPGDEEYGYGGGGMGLNPYQTRPDGERMARDWLAALTLKTATTRNGVPILPYQRSRCASWVPEGDHYLCEALNPPEGGWINDVLTGTAESGASIAFPVATLASTGLMDPDSPGGLLTHVAGSPTLARADWDDCTLPHSFTPDVTPFPEVHGGEANGLYGQTWRFEGDLRIVLNTNQARGWCGGTAEGPGRSGLDE